MNCNRTENLHALHDGELSALARTELEAHVASCPACAAELSRLRRMGRFLQAGAIPVMVPGAMARLRARLGAERVEFTNGKRTLRLAGWLTAAAAAVAVCCSTALVSIPAPSVAQHRAAPMKSSGDDANFVLVNAVAPGSEITAAESEDPLQRAISPDESKDDGRD